MSDFPKLHNFNDMYTPPIAMQYIAQFLPKDKVYWECCYWLGHMYLELQKLWFNVVWDGDMDCLSDQPTFYDIIITNPPFNWNKKFLKRAIELWKPFALLLRLEHIWWVDAMKLLSWLDFKIIIPEKRINYITSKIMRWEGAGGSPFHSIRLTYWIDLPKQINYVKCQSMNYEEHSRVV